MKEVTPCTIVLNGEVTTPNIKPSKVPGQILCLFNNIGFLSLENLKNKLDEIVEMCRETGILSHCGWFTRALTKIRNTDNRETILEFIYNTILSSEDCGLLYGYSYGIAERNGDTGKMQLKTALWYNAEKISIRQAGI